MNDLKLRLLGDEVLTKPTVEVAEVTEEVRRHVNQMVDMMYATGGIGLAANQVGLPYRLFVMDAKQVRDKKGRLVSERNPIVMINPRIIETSDPATLPEGCLSIPGQEVKLERYLTVTVEYMDLEGETRTGICMGVEAQCVQHEIDHLDGKLMIDHLPESTRNLTIARYMRDRRKR